MIRYEKRADGLTYAIEDDESPFKIEPVMPNIIVKIKYLDNYPFDFGEPKYADNGSSGFDIMAAEDFTITEGETVLVPTGISVEVPKGYEMQIRSRSGLAVKENIFVLNGVGTLDSSYRGQIQVILHKVITTSKTKGNCHTSVSFRKGDRIAQGVICPVYRAVFVQEELSKTERGEGGFGHSGISG